MQIKNRIITNIRQKIKKLLQKEKIFYKKIWIIIGTLALN
jgi:hypothetical protein